MARRTVLALVALLGLTAGCGRSVEVVDAPPAPAARIQLSWAGCDAVGAFDRPTEPPDRTGQGTLPVGFVPTRAVLCTTGEQTSTSGDLVGTDVERTATDLDPLLVYLARPSQLAGSGETICPAMAWFPPALYLTDADDHWIVPAIPTDACGFALDMFSDAEPVFDRLAYRDRVVRETGVIESAAARATGCEMEWKDMVTMLTTDVFAADHRARPATVRADPWPDGQLTSCVYTVRPTRHGSDLPAGTFTSGRVLTSTQGASVRRTVRGAAAAATCRTSTTQFAVVTDAQRSTTVYVELAGCHRILVDDGSARLAQGDAALAAALTG